MCFTPPPSFLFWESLAESSTQSKSTSTAKISTTNQSPSASPEVKSLISALVAKSVESGVHDLCRLEQVH